MRVIGNDDLMMTGRRLLRLDKALRRLVRLDGMLVSYQGMLVNPLSRLGSILDVLAPSSLHGTEREAVPPVGQPYRETGEFPTATRRDPSPEAASSAPGVVRHKTNFRRAAKLPAAHHGSEPPALTTSRTTTPLAHLPEAYLLWRETGRCKPVGEVRSTRPESSGTLQGVARNRAELEGESLTGLSSLTERGPESGSTPGGDTRSDEAFEARTPLLDGPSRFRAQGRFIAGSLMSEGRTAGENREPVPDPKQQRHASPQDDLQPGIVRLSRGGASLASILRHNLAQGQPALERRETGFSRGSTSMPERGKRPSNSNPELNVENGGEHGLLVHGHDVPAPRGGEEDSRLLSAEQMDQIMDTLAEQLEISLLRAYGTTRR